MGSLEKFIKENRSQMDDLVPSEKLWAGISAGVGKSLIIKSKLAWLKLFGFGASVVAITVGSYLYVSKNSDIKKPVHSKVAIEDSVKPSLSENNIAEIIQKPEQIPANNEKPVSENPVKVGQTQKEELVQEKTESENLKSAAEVPLTEAKVIPVKTSAFGLDTVFSNIKSLSLNVSCFNVNIDPAADGDKVHIYSSIQPVNGEFEIKGKKFVIEYERSGTELKVAIVMKEKNTNIECTHDLNLYIEVPDNIDIQLSTAFGDINAKKLNSSVCEFKSASGNINVQDISSNLKVSNSFGDFKGSRLKGNISIKSASGNLQLSDAEGEINALSAFGKTELMNVKGKVKSVASSGKTVVKNCEGEFNISNAYGDITFDHFKGFGNFVATSGNITGTEMNLTGDIKLVTNFGAIKMNLDNPYSELSFDTKTLFGVIHIDKDGQKIHADKRFKGGKGRILITAVTQSGNQDYH
jgi:hypothetical protein